MELPELRRRVRLVPPGAHPADDLLRGLKQRVMDFGFGPTGNHLKLSGDTLKAWLNPPPPVVPQQFRPVSRDDLKLVRLQLMAWPRGASAALIGGRTGLGTSRAEAVLATLVNVGEASEHIGKYVLTEVAYDRL